MSKKRMSDTAAIAASPMGDNTSRTVSVRKIENGYVKSESTSGDGEYKCSEVFSDKNPGLGDTHKENTGLSAAVQFAKR